MVLVVFIHLLRVFVTASYKYPRELTWLIGVGLLLLHPGDGLHRLPAALEPEGLLGHHGRHLTSPAACPFLGDFILKALRGGPDLSALTLQPLLRRPHLDAPRRCWPALIGVHLFLHHQARRIRIPGQGRLKERGMKEEQKKNILRKIQDRPAKRRALLAGQHFQGSAGLPGHLHPPDPAGHLHRRPRRSQSGPQRYRLRPQAGMVLPVPVQIPGGLWADPAAGQNRMDRHGSHPGLVILLLVVLPLH